MLRDIFKRTVAFVVIERRTLPLVGLRRTVGFVLSVKRAELILFNRPVDVVCYKQVELAVVIIIKPNGTGREARIANAGPGRDIRKLAATDVAKEMIWPN